MGRDFFQTGLIHGELGLTPAGIYLNEHDLKGLMKRVMWEMVGAKLLTAPIAELYVCFVLVL